MKVRAKQFKHPLILPEKRSAGGGERGLSNLLSGSIVLCGLRLRVTGCFSALLMKPTELGLSVYLNRKAIFYKDFYYV